MSLPQQEPIHSSTAAQGMRICTGVQDTMHEERPSQSLRSWPCTNSLNYRSKLQQCSATGSIVLMFTHRNTGITACMQWDLLWHNQRRVQLQTLVLRCALHDVIGSSVVGAMMQESTSQYSYLFNEVLPSFAGTLTSEASDTHVVEISCWTCQ
jgi:hypothetical protein